MSKIKERCMWFIGANRLQGSRFKKFMYSESDIILFNYDTKWNIVSKSKDMIIGMTYTVAKQGLK